jgi:hypothetical protein
MVRRNSIIDALKRAHPNGPPKSPPPDRYPEDQLGDTYEGDIEPEAPEPKNTPTWPDPPGEAAFRGLAGEIVHRIDPETEADPVAVLVQFLVCFGSACGRAPHYKVGATPHCPNLYAVLIGRTAKARKGTSLAWPRAIIAGADSEWGTGGIISGLSSGEGLIAALEQDGSPTKRILAVEEEFARVLRVCGREGSIVSPVLRQLWDRDEVHALNRKNPLHAKGCHFSLVGHVTQEELISCLSQNDVASGLANRCLWVAVKRSKYLPDGGALLDLNELVLTANVCLAKARTTGQMGRDKEARDLWHQVYPRLTADRPGMLGLILARAEAQVLRLSLLYALLDDERTIRRPHLEAALELWGYCERSCQWVFGETTGNRDADEILHGLRSSPGGLNKTEILKLFGGHKSARDVDRALALLVENDLAIAGKPAAGRQPAQNWRAK